MLETERLRLRPLRAGDADEISRWVSDPAFVRHLGGRWDRARVAEMLARAEHHRAERGFGPLAVEERASGRLVGRSGLAFHAAWPDDPEVGWWIAPERQGLGLATEAGEASLRHAFDDLGLERIVSIAVEANVPSRRVMAKLGLHLHARVPSEWGELLVHALERRDFVAGRAPR